MSTGILSIKVAGLIAGGSLLSSIALPDHLLIVSVSGLCGGMCRWIADKSHIWPHGLGTMVSGAFVATFLWPFGQSFLGDTFSKLEMDPTTAMMLGAFISGLLGMSLIGFILDIFASHRKEQEADNAGDP